MNADKLAKVRPMKACEVVGIGPHDGMHFDVPENVISTVVVTRNLEGALHASCAIERSAHVDRTELADVLLQLAWDLVE